MRDLGIVLTGATGFVGSAVLHRLNEEDRRVTAVSRRPKPGLVQVGELGPETDWSGVFDRHEVVIHAAARVHVMDEQARDPLFAFQQANVEGTARLAEEAARCGVRQFIFISSIKVNGEETLLGHPFLPSDPPAPQDAYGTSKAGAETRLREISDRTGMEVVIIRPPLVYGPGVKANFRRMMQWLVRGVPLPLGAIRNLRSLVGLDNLVDLIVTCIGHPAAQGETFLVSDDNDVSTTELLEKMAAALGRPARLVPIPSPLLLVGATVLGRRPVARRLLGSLQVDISQTRTRLGWTPPVSLDEGLRRAARAFLDEEGG